MSEKDDFVFGSFRLSAKRRELLANGTPVQVGSRAFDLLLALVRRQGQLATKDELMAEVWPGRVVGESNLQVQVSALRKVLSQGPEGAHFLITIPSWGYRFVPPVEPDGSPNAAVSPAHQDLSLPTLALPDKPSIAVLPFANISGDPEQEYFADGMAEEIITALSRCIALRDRAQFIIHL
jgi:DNA-binding winged helix-turn-helix (wHTH) protein